MSCPQAVRASDEERESKSGTTSAPPSVWRTLRGAVPSFCQGLATCEAAPSVPSSEARARPPRSGHLLRLLGDDSAGDSQAITLLQRAACPEEAAGPLERSPFPAPRIAGEGRGSRGAPPGPGEHPLPVPQLQKVGSQDRKLLTLWTVSGLQRTQCPQRPWGRGPGSSSGQALLLGRGVLSGK